MAFLEAIAACKPIITVDGPPMGEFVTHGLNGLVCAAHQREYDGIHVPGLDVDVAALAECMKLMTDGKKYQTMVSGAKKERDSRSFDGVLY